MMLRKQILLPSSLSIALIAVFFGFQNCGKQAATKQQVNQQSEEIIRTNLRVDDLNNILFGMLEDERSERIAADQNILNQLTVLRSDMMTQLSSVDAEIKNMNTSLVRLSAKDDEFSQQLKSIESNAAELEKNFGIKLLESNESLFEALKTSKDELAGKLAIVDQKIEQLRDQSDENIKSIQTNRERIAAAIQSQAIFENFVSQMYATKSELNTQKELYRDLEVVVKSLDLRLTRTTQEIAETLGQRVFELTSRINSIELKVSSQGKSIEAFQQDLASAVQEYRQGHEELSKQLQSDIELTKKQLGSLLLAKNDSLRAEMLQELNRKSLELTLYTNKSVTLLSNSLTDLSNKVNTNDSAQSLALSQFRREVVEAISNEQRERKLLGEDLENLIRRVVHIEQSLGDLKAMTEQNHAFYKRLHTDFEEEKINVAKRFAQQTAAIDLKFQELRNDFESRLKELGTHAENLVSSLGADVQKNFKSANLEIAALSNRQSNAEKRLETFLEEYQADRSRSSSFSARIAPPFRLAQASLASGIDALNDVQQRFVQLLAPDDENPDFYNEDLRRYLQRLNKKCEPASDTKFVNIYGMDSFQLISIEYVRLLLMGLQSGDAQRDRIFFSYGPAGTNRLSQSVVMGLLQTPSHDVDTSCRFEVQQWARGIILNDERFKPISDALAEDDQLERRVSVLYGILQSIASPLDEIQKQVEQSIVGIRDGEAAFESMIRQTALDLVNAAWDSRQLSDRLALVDEMERIQTTQNEQAEEMKKGFGILRGMLKEFEEKTNVRLVRLEEQQGKMTLSMKRALDVLISLADRGGYEDLKAYVRWAGEPIAHVPLIYPNWSPRITSVQHFFSGRLSLRNTTDACSGAKVLARGGIGGAFQFGAWGPCWVNFRSVPLPSWGNEFRTLWLRIFGSGHLIRIHVDPSVQRDNIARFRDYNYDRLFDFRLPNPLLKLWGSFENGVFDLRAPDLLDYYLKHIRSWGGVTLSIQSIREDSIGQEVVQKSSNVFRYTIQVFSPLIIDFHKSGLPTTISYDESKVKMNFVSDKKFERSGWVSGHEAGFLVRRFLPIGTSIEKDHLFAQGQICQGSKVDNGFESLKCFDSNSDATIDKRDLAFNRLQVFFDYNSNGVVDAGEMASLVSLGVERLSLNYDTIPEEQGVQNGNDMRYTSKANDKDDQFKANVIDVYFGVAN